MVTWCEDLSNFFADPKENVLAVESRKKKWKNMFPSDSIGLHPSIHPSAECRTLQSRDRTKIQTMARDPEICNAAVFGRSHNVGTDCTIFGPWLEKMMMMMMRRRIDEEEEDEWDDEDRS